jgi:hypothetical protein
MTKWHDLPELVEAYRDRQWHRESEERIDDVLSAERFIERVGFCSALTDCRRPGPSLYIAVCGRRDAYMPRNVQKDPESRLAWSIKDDAMRRGRVFYAKLKRGRLTFIARRMLPYFHALWGVSPAQEADVLSDDAKSVLRVLRREWEMGTRDLRLSTRIADRARFNRAIDDLQKTFKLIPGDVIYKPTFSYIWSLAESRFQDELDRKVSREEALKEIARAYLSGAGTLRGELARVTGLSRLEAGLGSWSLVDDGVALRIEPGVYKLRELAYLELESGVRGDNASSARSRSAS